MDTTRRLSVALAMTTLAAGTLLAGTPGANADDHWPSDASWVPVHVAGAPIADVAEDDAPAQIMDIVGDAEHPAAYVHTTAGDVAGAMSFRLRLDADPRHPTSGFIRGGQWIVQLSTNEDPNAYDMAVMVQGGGAELWTVFKNTDRDCCTNDLPEEELWSDRLMVGVNVRAVPADTSYSGTPDYFLDWQVPLSDGTNALTGATGPVRFLFGTTVFSDGTLGHGDVAGPTGPQTAWEPTGSDVYARSIVDGNLVRDTTPPTVEFPALPAFALGKVGLAWSGADQDTGIAGYDLEQRTARWNSTLGPGSRVLTRSELTGVRRTMKKGSTSCYTLRSVNGAHLTSDWAGPQCVARPLDQGALRPSSGWRTVKSPAFWGGTALVSSRRGTTLTLTGVRARRLAVVATTCSSCGKVAVLLDGVSRGVIDLRSTRTKNRRLIELPAFPNTKGKLQLEILSAKRPVKIDGFGISAG